MKTIVKFNIFLAALLTLASFTSKFKENNMNGLNVPVDSSNTYADGTYEGYSRSIYTSEPYWGYVNLNINNGAFSNIYFIIRDSSTHEPVDSMYGVIHFPGNPAYQQQCVNDGHGIEIYPQKLLTIQNLDNVDAITGATWSYNIFNATVKEALKDAKKTSSIINKPSSKSITLTAKPNPFKSEVVLNYSLQESGFIELSIFDINGKLIDNLVKTNCNPGSYSVTWNTIPKSGIYIYQIRSNDFILGGRLICTK